MLHPSLAFAWLFWRRFRILFFVVSGCLFFMAVLSSYYSPRIVYHELTLGELAFGVLYGLSRFSFVFLLWIFLFVQNPMWGGRESCFPPRMFQLPVSTSSLVTWPMVYGAFSAIFLWLAFAIFVFRPLGECCGVTAPLWWPGLFLAAISVWTQALLWTPFGLRGLRAFFLYSLLGIIYQQLLWFSLDYSRDNVSTPLVWIVDKVFSENRKLITEPLLVALYAILMLIGWLVGYVGVRQARCGNVPDWQAILEPLRKLDRWLRRPRSPMPFASAAQAQVWFEWRRRAGSGLAVFTAAILVSILILQLALDKDHAIPLRVIILSTLAVPVFFAGLSGGDWLGDGIGKNPKILREVQMMSLIATLPMSCVDMVGAILKTALWSTLLAWAITFVTVTLAILLTGKFQNLANEWQQIVHEDTPGAIVAGGVAIAVWLVVWTWKRRVDSLYIDWVNRTWLTRVIAFASLFGYSLLSFFIAFIMTFEPIRDHLKVFEPLLTLLPWLLTLLILGRLLLAGCVFCEILRQGLVEPRTAVRWLASWLLIASALFVLLVLTVSTKYVPVYYVAFAVLFAMPMVRLTAAPLALAWNRHR